MNLGQDVYYSTQYNFLVLKSLWNCGYSYDFNIFLTWWMATMQSTFPLELQICVFIFPCSVGSTKATLNPSCFKLNSPFLYPLICLVFLNRLVLLYSIYKKKQKKIIAIHLIYRIRLTYYWLSNKVGLCIENHIIPILKALKGPLTTFRCCPVTLTCVTVPSGSWHLPAHSSSILFQPHWTLSNSSRKVPYFFPFLGLCPFPPTW